MGTGQKILIQVGLGGVSHLWVGKISPKSPKFSNFFPSG